jgi:hypothetical protein
MKIKTVIGISGFARSGKDTLASLVDLSLNQNGTKSKIFSFASALKLDMKDFFEQKLGISPFTNDTILKEKIRPILISYGNVQRTLSNGTYWFNRLKPEINKFFETGGDVAVIPDLRFKEYEFDEYDFVRSFGSSFIITVSRKLDDGSFNKPAHESEEKSFPFFKNVADFNLIWKTHTEKSLIEKDAKECIDSIFKFLNSKK